MWTTTARREVHVVRTTKPATLGELHDNDAFPLIDFENEERLFFWHLLLLARCATELNAKLQPVGGRVLLPVHALPGKSRGRRKKEPGAPSSLAAALFLLLSAGSLSLSWSLLLSGCRAGKPDGG